MDVLNGKILLTTNDKYIILCKDQNNIINDEINSSSSSPTANNSNLITKYQLNKRAQQYHTEFFQNGNEYKKVLGSTTTFNCRNITPSNEYYL
jgi:hypothetical protein